MDAIGKMNETIDEARSAKHAQCALRVRQDALTQKPQCYDAGTNKATTRVHRSRLGFKADCAHALREGASASR